MQGGAMDSCALRLRIPERPRGCQAIRAGLVAGLIFGLGVRYIERSVAAQTAANIPAERANHLIPVQRNRPSAQVAICVGGWLELSIPRRGESIREHVLSIMPSDVFVAGTLRGNVSEARVTEALRGLSALAPFASASIIPMPRASDLRRELRRSGHWEDFKVQASKGGSGRFDWNDKAHDNPKLWVPIMLSPALGNPLGNTLQEFHYQSRCIQQIDDYERTSMRGGKAYERVMFTRLEFEWLYNHPPLSLLDPRYMWVPTGEDNTGINDRHWLVNRKDAAGVFRRWDDLINGRFHAIFFAATKVRPAFMSSETYQKLHIQYYKVAVARFPNVAFLQCCSSNYNRATTNKRNMRCFAKFCHTVLCPRPLQASACNRQTKLLSFKYNDEGRSAAFHATALSLPGARFSIAQDMRPPRLHIEYPHHGAQPGLLYTCKTCETADTVNAVSLNVTGCLFTQWNYNVAVLDEARKSHSCRYFDERTLSHVCTAIAPGELAGQLYSWWCQKSLPLL